MNSSKRFSDSQNQTYALLSIRPQFVSEILSGRKKYEFRRVIFSRPVDVIIVYATSPVQQVAFEFDVASVIHEPLSTLWKLTRDDAGINKALFSKYFEGCQKGYAIQIGEIRRYETPFSPLVSYGLRPPQSFVYLNKMKQKQTYLLTGFIAI